MTDYLKYDVLFKVKLLEYASKHTETTQMFMVLELLTANKSGDLTKIREAYDKIQKNPEYFELKDELVTELMETRQIMTKLRDQKDIPDTLDLSSREAMEVWETFLPMIYSQKIIQFYLF